MHRMLSALTGAAFCAFALSAPAVAHVAARFGAVAHNIKFSDGNSQSNESGANVEAEAIGDPLRALRWIAAPRPYLMASVNTRGDTSFGAAGLYWRILIARKWTLEPGFGVAVHDGALHNSFPASDPRADSYAREHQLLGTEILFRDTLAIDRDIGRGRSIGLVYEHLSNGGETFGHRDNQSLNELGLRLTLDLP